MSDLLNVDLALERILVQIHELPVENLHIADALGRVLSEDIHASINLPPFANSSMDGYAVRAADIDTATSDTPVSLKVVMDIPAGAAPVKTLNAGEAARIMTGAPMPEGADAVVPVEDTDSQWGQQANAPLPGLVSIFRWVRAGDYVRPIGENIREGQQVLTAGTVLRPQEIGVLAALGQATVSVRRSPKVVILSNGDELVSVEEPLAPGKIRDVNSYTLAGMIHEAGGVAFALPIAKDTPEAIQQMFNDALAQQPDMIVSSAGVSVGAADYVTKTLEAMGQMNFWRINLRPGKPLAFGLLQGIPFFGLPGNPVSVMVTFDVLVRPALRKQGGYPDSVPMITATVGEALKSDGRRSYLRVKLIHEDGQWVATTTGTQSSGALMSMVLADGLLIVPEGETQVDAGTRLQVRLLKPLSP